MHPKMRLICFCALLLVPQSSSYPQQKAKVVGNTEIDSLSDKQDTAKARVVNEGDVKLDYQGKNGLIKQSGGTGEATQQGKGEKFNAIGPDGKKATGTVDKNKKVANVVDAKGNKVVADATDGHNINGKVNDKDNYKVVRDDNGNAEVFPKNSGTSAHKVANLRDGTDNIDIRTPNKPQRIEKLKTTKDASGKITNTDTSDAENSIPGIPIGSKNNAKMAYKGSSSSDLQIGKSIGATNNDALAVGAAGEVSSDSVDTKPCVSGPTSEDTLDSKTGININEKSVRFELIKDADGSYSFPSCFNAFADVFIPANIKIEDLSAHSKITSTVAGGDMQCDAKVTCQDSRTSKTSVPSGNCFFCDFCNPKQPQGAFGVGSEANICDAKGGRTLPLKWKLCPPPGSQGKFVPFLPTGQKAAGDIVAQLRLFLRSVSPKDQSLFWKEVACKQSIYSFKVGIADGPSYGSKASNTRLQKVQQTGNSAGSGFSAQSLFGR